MRAEGLTVLPFRSRSSWPSVQGLIAYLSAIPGEPHGATRPPAAISKLQQKQTGRPKSIMKMSKVDGHFATF